MIEEKWNSRVDQASKDFERGAKPMTEEGVGLDLYKSVFDNLVAPVVFNHDFCLDVIRELLQRYLGKATPDEVAALNSYLWDTWCIRILPEPERKKVALYCCNLCDTEFDESDDVSYGDSCPNCVIGLVVDAIPF